jgi:hypothetical protein
VATRYVKPETNRRPIVPDPIKACRCNTSPLPPTFPLTPAT